MAEQDKTVADYLALIMVNFNAVLVQKGFMKDDWECDKWSVTFVRPGKKDAIESPYHMGTGHRKLPARLVGKNPHRGATKNYGRREAVKWNEENGRPTAPTAASTLHSLLLDADGAEGNFNDWCDNYDYDRDSRKALAMYDECMATNEKLRKFFSHEERTKLSELLEDY